MLTNENGGNKIGVNAKRRLDVTNNFVHQCLLFGFNCYIAN